MLSTMPEFPLTVRHILAHGRTIYPNSQVVTAEAGGLRRISFDRLAERVDRLAAALRHLGIQDGERVGVTFAIMCRKSSAVIDVSGCLESLVVRQESMVIRTL